MKFIRVLDLSLQLLILATGLLLALFHDPLTALLAYSFAIALVQSCSHLYFYFQTRNWRSLTRGRRFFHILFIALTGLLSVLLLALLFRNRPFMGEIPDSLFMFSSLGLAFLGIPSSLYYIGLTVYELRMYLYLQAQSEAVDFGA